MSFELLTSLTETVNEQQEHEALVERVIKDVFGDDVAATPAECAAIWEAAKVNKTPIEEARVAGQNRSAELDWIATMRGDHEEQGDSRKLGIKTKASPEKGHMVAMQGGVGQIVAVEPTDQLVIIKAKNGEERVFPFSQLEGPKDVGGKKAWALKA